MARTGGERRPRVAIVEPNSYHEEIVFAFASVLARIPGGADVCVYARENRGSQQFLHEDLVLPYPWRPFDAVLDPPDRQPPLDLVLIGTFPSTAGQPELCRLLAGGTPVFALVHDIDYFMRPDGAEAELARWPNLTVGYPGAAPARPPETFPELMRDRITRFVPVMAFGPYSGLPRLPGADQDRTGVALPGSIEFARRDFALAVRLTAEADLPLRIFGRSRIPGASDPAIARRLEADRRQLFGEIKRAGAIGRVEVRMDLSCRDYWRTLRMCRFVAIMPTGDSYLRGKLTGAVTAALSAQVPMLATPEAHAYYTGADPAVFTGCMLPFDPVGRHASGRWRSIVRNTSPQVYDELCEATGEAREMLLAENVDTLAGVLSWPGTSAAQG